MTKLLIRNALVLNRNEQLVTQNIVAHEGSIRKISSPESEDGPEQDYCCLDAQECIAIPGMIDLHTHVREPGYTYKENFRSASMAAAKGGVTTFFDMPNTNPPTTSIEALSAKRSLAKTSIVDYALHFGADANSDGIEIERCRNMHENLPASIKLFLNKTTGNLMIENTDLLEALVARAWFITAHAEEEKIESILTLTQKYSVPLYLCHISRKSEIDYIIEARKKLSKDAAPVFIEVCPHHLAFTRTDLLKNPLLRMMPPLQNEEDRDALWKALLEGEVDSVGSDHAPHTLSEKNTALLQKKNLYGVPGLEASLLFLLDKVAKGLVPLRRALDLLSKNPAKIFKIKKKGALEVNKDADIVLINLKKDTSMDNREQLSKSAWSPFHNITFAARIEACISRGSIVYLSHAMKQRVQNFHPAIALSTNRSGSVFLQRGKELRFHVT